MSDFDLAVLEFVTESGLTATLVQTVEGEYDPSTGSVDTTENLTSVQGILMDLTLQSNGLSVKYGTLVEAGDKEFLMRPPHKTNNLPDPVAIQPASDRITIAGTTYKIVTLKELNPTATDPVLVSLYLRR
jgi:hypothetical protein